MRFTVDSIILGKTSYNWESFSDRYVGALGMGLSFSNGNIRRELKAEEQCLSNVPSMAGVSGLEMLDCDTRYPLLLVHGIFFRDYEHRNYWGRIPEVLEKLGAKVYYGCHQSASSVEDSARELADRIRTIVEETGCEKLNIVAHSKGGLDAKYAVAMEGIEDMVASVTTISTPHEGCEYADYLISQAPERLSRKLNHLYYAVFKMLGDDNPDFVAGVSSITVENCKIINEKICDFDFQEHGIYTQSVGSQMKTPKSSVFIPLNASYKIVRDFDGPNDGLVGTESFSWGERYIFVENSNNIGITHGDMIDLTRQNIDGFDVRQFYVNLVNDMKNRGM